MANTCIGVSCLLLPHFTDQLGSFCELGGERAATDVGSRSRSRSGGGAACRIIVVRRRHHNS